MSGLSGLGRARHRFRRLGTLVREWELTPSSPVADYPTTASRSADRVADHAAADRSAPVLSAAPLIRVAPARHASVLGTADDVGRKVHHATPTYVATLAVSSKQMSHVYDRHHAWRRACLSARRASKEARV